MSELNETKVMQHDDLLLLMGVDFMASNMTNIVFSSIGFNESR